ncbi:hypothetical protein SAMN04488688_110213 [Paenibacillus sp. cl141a]|uniref:hypothetical protein n=1 Tax=Bacillales TaxID=1385 RepID=UPI000178969F|nr:MULTISPECIES: hypothetical protein [Paenibacillus]ACX63420.1 conserved hypothetical protein [Paenibacillus sp. Y412MC10]EGG34969.1 hypothetical protein HMPREF9412_2301 [Paenibacillus sp. HGF5]ETT64475.1 hypothetical protein C172_12688 [Paenibacillus sp. FSL H8-457]MCM3260578.1 hypothetical protein [Paenibacillus lautus]SEM25833.1 hypothetical protein SAMN04488688_110213 [Paenibacillus sp. cl141a]
MTDEYFDEMRKFGHEDEMRYRMLMRGVKKLLEQRKREKSKLFGGLPLRQKHKTPRAGKWS